MKCLICNTDIEAGGIIAQGVSVMWIPMSEFQKKGIKRVVYTNGKIIGKHNVILGQTKISNAYFCNQCNKVIEVFDVEQVL